MILKYLKDEEKFQIIEGTKIEYHQLNLWLTRYTKGYRFDPRYKAGVWNGKQSYFKDGKVALGLWKEMFLASKEIGVPFKVINKDEIPINREVTLESVENFCKEYFKDHKVKVNNEWVPFMPYEHQIHAAYKILKNRFCMAEVATSGGKSLIISIVVFYTLKYIEPNAKFLLIVPSITLVTQFYDGILEYNQGANFLEENKENTKAIEIRVEEIMSEKPRKYTGTQNANIYIGTYQSLDKWERNWFKQFHTVITDESHKAKSRTILKLLKRTFKYAYSRFGVSGTYPGENSLEILTLQSVMGPKITEVTADELKHKGIITPMEIKAVLLNHNYEELNDRILKIRKAGAGKDAFELEKRFIHASEKRLEFIKNIVAKCDANTLVLFHSIEYGEKIFEKLKKDLPDKDFYYIDGTVSGKKREVIKKEMEKTSEKTKVLIASFGTLSTGVSIRAIFNVIFADSFKSESLIIQSIGRALRLHTEKDKAIIFDLVDVFHHTKHDNILYSHFKERSSFYKKRKYPFKVVKINL